MNAEPKRRPLCHCCEVAPGTRGDPNLGPGCPDCCNRLKEVRDMFEDIGPLIGIAPYSNEVNR